MKGYLLDTHVWFWYLVGSPRLPPGLREAMDTSAGASWYSPISVWELSMLAQRNRIRMEGRFRDWVSSALEQFPLREAPVNLEVALLSQEIRLPHRDPAHHFLAATALVYELTLLTVDRHLSEASWLATRSE